MYAYFARLNVPILIYSKSQKEHKEHVRKILAKLEEAGLYVKAEKCEFSVSSSARMAFPWIQPKSRPFANGRRPKTSEMSSAF
jgi:hypothetical protein